MIRNKEVSEAFDKLSGDDKAKVLVEHYIQALERQNAGLQMTVKNLREKEEKRYERLGWRD